MTKAFCFELNAFIQKADIDVMGEICYFVPVLDLDLGISPFSIKEPNETKVSCSVLN